MTKVFISPEAETDLHEIALYIAAEHPAAASRMIQAFKELCGQLAVTPEIGPVRELGAPDLEGLRMIRLPGFRHHLVFYQVVEDGARVDVWRVVDGRRDLPSQLAEWRE